MSNSTPSHDDLQSTVRGTRMSTKLVLATGFTCLASATAVFASISQNPSVSNEAGTSNVSDTKVSVKHVTNQEQATTDNKPAAQSLTQTEASSSNPSTQVVVNGSAVPLPTNGEAHTSVVTGDDGNTKLNVSINSSSTGSNSSDTSLELTVDSSSKISSGG